MECFFGLGRHLRATSSFLSFTIRHFSSRLLSVNYIATNKCVSRIGNSNGHRSRGLYLRSGNARYCGKVPTGAMKSLYTIPKSFLSTSINFNYKQQISNCGNFKVCPKIFCLTSSICTCLFENLTILASNQPAMDSCLSHTVSSVFCFFLWVVCF